MELFQAAKVLLISDLIYRLFLLAYPAAFRRDFGPEMTQVFRDSCREVYQQRGILGVFNLWVPTILDLVVTAFEEHLLEGLRMSRSNVIRRSGLAILSASVLGIATIVSMQLKLSLSLNDLPGDMYPIYHYAKYLFMLAGLTLLCGVIGLLLGYGSQVGSWGRVGLVLSIVGLGIGGGGIATVYFLNVGRAWREWAWYDYGLGCLLLHLGMALFCLAILQRRILSPWNASLLITGLLIPLLTGFAYAFGLWTFNDFPFAGLGMMLLGYVFYLDRGSGLYQSSFKAV
jgi:hypothetical protein